MQQVHGNPPRCVNSLHTFQHTESALRMNVTKIPLLIMSLLMILAAKPAAAEGLCGSLKNHYGPYDYTNPIHKEKYLPIVDTHHFTSEVESLKGRVSTALWDDLDYTLRAFPNHHRALYAMARYQLIVHRPPNAQYRTAECYFERALEFKPDDAMVYLIYGAYLHRAGELQKALEKYQAAIKLHLDSAELDYNIGLLYVDLKQWELANKYAASAYQKGYPLPGLKDKLAALGKWQVPAK